MGLAEELGSAMNKLTRLQPNVRKDAVNATTKLLEDLVATTPDASDDLSIPIIITSKQSQATIGASASQQPLPPDATTDSTSSSFLPSTQPWPKFVVNQICKKIDIFARLYSIIRVHEYIC